MCFPWEGQETYSPPWKGWETYCFPLASVCLSQSCVRLSTRKPLEKFQRNFIHLLSTFRQRVNHAQEP